MCTLKFGGGCGILNRMVNAEEFYAEVIQHLYSFMEYVSFLEPQMTPGAGNRSRRPEDGVPPQADLLEVAQGSFLTGYFVV